MQMCTSERTACPQVLDILAVLCRPSLRTVESHLGSRVFILSSILEERPSPHSIHTERRGLLVPLLLRGGERGFSFCSGIPAGKERMNSVFSTSPEISVDMLNPCPLHPEKRKNKLVSCEEKTREGVWLRW